MLAATENLAEAATAAASDRHATAPHGHPLSQLFSGSSVGSGYGARSRHSYQGAQHSYPGAMVTHDDMSSSGSEDQLASLQSPTAAATHAAAPHAGEAAAAGEVSTAAAQLRQLAVHPGPGSDADGPAGHTGASGAGADANAALSHGGSDSRMDGSSHSHADSRSSSPFAGPAGVHASSSVMPGAIQGPLELLGELMLQAHASYSTCGLGSDGTNRLVNIVRQHMMSARRSGSPPVLYGAKITGGGSGGTVCVLGLSGPAGQAAVDAVVAQYREETGYQPFVFAGSSMGAVAFGHLRVKLRQETQQ